MLIVYIVMKKEVYSANNCPMLIMNDVLNYLRTFEKNENQSERLLKNLNCYNFNIFIHKRYHFPIRNKSHQYMYMDNNMNAINNDIKGKNKF